MHTKMTFLAARAVSAQEQMDQILDGGFNWEKNGEAEFYAHIGTRMHTHMAMPTPAACTSGQGAALEAKRWEIDHLSICFQG